jgi:hypothetical protein
MKTAIQEIIDKYYQSSIYRCEFTEWLIENKELLLEKEKEQIMNAYSIGFLVSKDLDMPEASSYVTNDYYNQAHNQNK